MDRERIQRLGDLARWVGEPIKGDENGEAQVFLDRFFRRFGDDGTIEAGATYQERIKRLDGQDTSFAELVGEPVVLLARSMSRFPTAPGGRDADHPQEPVSRWRAGSCGEGSDER
jgi:hypothetical protein